MEKFDELKTLVNNLEEDAIKFYEKGNKAAGVRLRKGLQEIKTLSQYLRQDVSAKNKQV
jgi:exonuclease VII small subunit